MPPRKTTSFQPDTRKFELVHQIGGIQTATLDSPGLGSGTGTRVALFNTGGGLRFTVALDRGGDIVDAFWQQHSLAWRSPVGCVPPDPARHHGLHWLDGWPGGLITTCGPQYMGGPREEDGHAVSLHGRHSNTPAQVVSLENPDPHQGRMDMRLVMLITDTSVFGHHLQVRREIRCTLGQNTIHLHDEVLNRGDQKMAHNWLYHCNFGYPLLDAGTRLIFKGGADFWQRPQTDKPTSALLNRLKTITDPLNAHIGGGEQGMILTPPADRKGLVHVGLINERLALGVELCYPAKDLPRLANWQHLGPAGSYVTGLEPFYGSLLGKAKDPDQALANTWLKPGQKRSYQLTLNVLSDAAALKALAHHDGKVTLKR